MERLGYTKTVLDRCVGAERGAMPIISKCHQEMHRAIQSIDPLKDTEAVSERY